MRLRLHCYTCMAKDQITALAVTMPLNATGVYPVTCGRGHRTVAVLQQSHFEVLAEAGIQAIVDGYYRDGVLSFASAFERFQQFVFEIVAASFDGSDAAIKATWKVMARQSERQHGAYLASYLFAFGEPAPVLQSKQIELRNDVAHKGAIPTIDQSIDYAQAVTNAIHATSEKMKGRFDTLISQSITNHLTQGHLAAAPGVPVVTHFHPMFLSVGQPAGAATPNVLSAVQRRMLADGGD